MMIICNKRREFFWNKIIHRAVYYWTSHATTTRIFIITIVSSSLVSAFIGDKTDEDVWTELSLNHNYHVRVSPEDHKADISLMNDNDVSISMWEYFHCVYVSRTSTKATWNKQKIKNSFSFERSKLFASKIKRKRKSNLQPSTIQWTQNKLSKATDKWRDKKKHKEELMKKRSRNYINQRLSEHNKVIT